MTKNQKKAAFEMLLEGKTLQEIAKIFGVSKQYIHQILSPVACGDKGEFNGTCIFPNIKKWLNQNGMNLLTFANLCGFTPRVARVTLSSGIESLSKIRAILRVTGMTFEEAFEENIDAPQCGSEPDVAEAEMEESQ